MIMSQGVGHSCLAFFIIFTPGNQNSLSSVVNDHDKKLELSECLFNKTLGLILFFSTMTRIVRLYDVSQIDDGRLLMNDI
jgi:hypothetical protein